jgi:hypothetical protein
MRKASSAELLAAASAVAPGFDTPANCTQCGEAFRAEEVITRRVYELRVGLALAALCVRCTAALPMGSVAETEFLVSLERTALASVPPQGRA